MAVKETRRVKLAGFAFVCLIIAFAIGYNIGIKQAEETFPAPSEMWVKDLGVRIDAGVTPDTVRLTDGTWRMYYAVKDGIVSATSINGMDWVKEQGIRIEPDATNKEIIHVTSPSVFTIDKDKFRMIYEGSDSTQRIRKLYSAVSKDGVNWEKEKGVRLDDVNEFDQKVAAVPQVVKLPGGGMRMYYSDGIRIKVAESKDQGVTWKKLGFATGLATPSMDPSVIISGGSYRIYYTTSDSSTEPKNLRVVSAHSDDGIHWTEDTGVRVKKDKDAQMVMDPDAVAISMGKIRMYYSQVDKGSLSNPKDPPTITIRSATLEVR